ncbi:MAG: PilZ domain-containing protein [Desulfonauticus sp.]|nr:PilZ domain-containing protein [Desulfonauticus sp.]
MEYIEAKDLNHYLLDLISELSKEEKIVLLEELEWRRKRKDRRRYLRRPFFIEIKYSDGEKVLRNFSRDISAKGVFIESKDPIEVGSNINLTIQLPGVKFPIQTRARVVRKSPDGIGVEFVQPITYIRRLIEREIQVFIKYKIILNTKIFLKDKLPDVLFNKVLSLKTKIREFRNILLKLRSSSLDYYCPVCEKKIPKFISAYIPPRPHARCPNCGSLERHRLDWIFLKEKTDLLVGYKNKIILHVAPEEILKKKFMEIPNSFYVSMDLKNPRAMVRADVIMLPFGNDSFHFIYCSHVLEHVLDDLKAMKELHRVLKPGGYALLQVPITSHKTFEDPTIKDPIERARVFGQYDHVRRYGLDYKDRLKKSGFKVTLYSAEQVIRNTEEFHRLGLDERSFVFFCEK